MKNGDRASKATQKLIGLRKQLPALAGQQMELIKSDSPRVLGYVRIREGHRLIVLAKFSESEQFVNGNRLRTSGLGRFFRDAISETTYTTSEPIRLHSYGLMWLQPI